jgi:D-aminoacyl-tRNA deacylase
MGVDMAASSLFWRIAPGGRRKTARRRAGRGRRPGSPSLVGVRAVVQTVSRASVTVAGEVVGAIGDGLLVLVGVTHSDTAATARTLARKIHELRILDGDESAATTAAPILVVSQFTLYGDTAKGRRPSWTAAAPAETAEPLVTAVVTELRERGAVVETGRFRAQMLVESVNVGPRTILLEV